MRADQWAGIVFQCRLPALPTIALLLAAIERWCNRTLASCAPLARSFLSWGTQYHSWPGSLLSCSANSGPQVSLERSLLHCCPGMCCQSYLRKLLGFLRAPASWDVSLFHWPVPTSGGKWQRRSYQRSTLCAAAPPFSHYLQPCVVMDCLELTSCAKFPLIKGLGQLGFCPPLFRLTCQTPPAS